jgi:trimethylamine:corrinoid methyltransferase-like protein
MDKRSAEKAKKEGVRPIQEVAKDVVRKILREHQPTPLDRDVERALAQIVKESEKTLIR